MKTNPRHGRAAFTLIELMAVITIIVILAGLVVAGMGFVNERQAKEKAKVQIALLSKAIEEYKSDMGRYPGNATNTPPAGTGVTSQLYAELFYEGYDYNQQSTPPATWTKKVGGVEIPKATKIYLPELDPTSSKQGWMDPVTGGNAPPKPSDTTMIKDPWGTEYRYRKGINAQNPDFDLWSCGVKGTTDTSNPSMSQPANKDDIRNF